MEDAMSRSETVRDDVLEVRFSITCEGERVPGLLFRPIGEAEPTPLVLIQHPGMGSKDDYFVAEVGRLWAQRAWTCAGLDAPLHGDRDEHNPMALFGNRERMPQVVDQFAREVSAAVTAIAETYAIDMARLAYVGYSLGSMLGIPAVAHDGRFRVAAFCLVGEGGGMVGPAAGEGSVVPKLGNVAVRIVAKEQDELVPREATEALFEALPGTKDIRWIPGGHFEIGPDVTDAASDWLRRNL